MTHVVSIWLREDQVVRLKGIARRMDRGKINDTGYQRSNSIGWSRYNRDEDGAWVSECPSIPGCVSQGQTKQEAADNIQDAIALCLRVRAEQELALTIETRQVEVTV